LAELSEKRFGGLFRLRGAGEMRLVRKFFDEFADARGLGNGAGLLLPLDFLRLRGGIESADGVGPVCIVRRGEEREGRGQSQNAAGGSEFHRIQSSSGKDPLAFSVPSACVRVWRIRK